VRVTAATPTIEKPRPAEFLHVPALDGLRAIAVLLVMGYHFGVPGLRGGFLGVDLFFTLSGFLITTLLLTEGATTGAIKLRGFWSRRARRLLPAVFGLLVVVAVSARFVAPDARPGLRSDLVSSILYFTNWHFIFQGHSYFAESQAPSPVGHLWSLAIEEQFYLVWPLLLAAAGVVVRRAHRPQRLRRAMVAVTAVAAFASAVALALRWDRFDPSRAYFATDTRAHELLIGAIAAMVVFPWQSSRERLHPRLVTVASLAGIAGTVAVVASAVTTHDSSAFYYHGGSVLFSLAATAAILGAVLGDRRGVLNRVLSLRAPVRIGAISYGLYLWHWPMKIWLTRDATHLSGAGLGLVRFVATFGVALLSYHVLEMPVRRARIGQFRLTNRPLAIGVVSAMTALLVLVFVTTSDGQSVPFYMRERAALTVDRGASRSSPVVAIVGDSVANSIAPAFKTVARQRGWATVNATFPSCAIGDLLRVGADHQLFGNARRCVVTAPTQQRLLVRRYHPRLVLWYSQRDRYDILWHGKVIEAGTPRWQSLVFADWDRALRRLRAGDAKVVLILPTYTVGTVPDKCHWPYPPSSRCDPWGLLGQGHLRSYYTSWASRHRSEVRVIEIDDLLCPDPSVKCPPLTVAGVNLRKDGMHYSDAGANWLVKRLVARLPEMTAAGN
jgi:peptidoglycan/LPS O-acetylase OafA/YrhL